MKINEGLSYDDILLIPGYASLLPQEIEIKTKLAGNIFLNVPIVSAAMDTVTEEKLAIALALEGGTGVIHRSLEPEIQAEQVGRVKRFLNWIIEKPLTITKNNTVLEARKLMNKNSISGLPVIDLSGKLCGIITSRDLRFCRDNTLKVDKIMTPNPFVESENVTPESAMEKFDSHRIEKLPVINSKGKLIGLITVKDMEKHNNYPNAATDSSGRLIVGAAVSPLDYSVRIPLLIEKKIDFVVMDTAHGDSKNVIKAIEKIKTDYNITVIGGNVATKEGTKHLIEAGADAVKVGVGPGSICTTRVVAGIGVPQFTAVLECSEEASKNNIPIIADGGIKYSGDITKAIAAGADSVMIGNLFAGLKETPGREIIYDGRMFKEYRGMGSIGAIQEGSGDRYNVSSNEEIVPEGIEGRVPFKGDLKHFLHQLTTGLQKGMGYCGCSNIQELKNYKKFTKITTLGLKESHAHDIVITHEAPNYSRINMHT